MYLLTWKIMSQGDRKQFFDKDGLSNFFLSPNTPIPHRHLIPLIDMN